MLTVVEKESQELKAGLSSSQKECEEVKKEHSALLQWKREKETLVSETEAVQKELTDKISVLEQELAAVNQATDQLKVKSCWLSHIFCFRCKTLYACLMMYFKYCITCQHVAFASLSTVEAAPERRGRQGQSVCLRGLLEGGTPQQEHRVGGEGASVQAAPVRVFRGWTETQKGPGKCCCTSNSASSAGYIQRVFNKCPLVMSQYEFVIRYQASKEMLNPWRSLIIFCTLR